jgi:vesicle-associated membrane protein 7
LPAFLDSLLWRWVAALGTTSASATDHSLDGVFRKDFGSLLDEYASTTELTREFDATQEVLAESAAKALDRGAELESVSSKSEVIVATSEKFRSQVASLKWKLRWE